MHSTTVGQVAGFSLHAGVVAIAHERRKLERLPLRDSPGGVGEAAIADTEWHDTLPAQDALSGWYDACDF